MHKGIDVTNGQEGVNLGVLDRVLTSKPDIDSGDLIYILQEIQTAYGFLPRKVLMKMSERTSIPISTVYGVATFYEQFNLEPRGKHIIRVCRGTACHVKGANELIETIKRTLNVEEGETAEDKLFTFETVACLGTCALAPVMVIDDVYHGKVTPKRAEELIEGLRKSASRGGD